MENIGHKESLFYNNLLESIKYARSGNVEKAYELAALYFDKIIFLDSKSQMLLNDGNADEMLCYRNRSIKYGLVYTARLARLFAHFLLVEAVQQAQSTNDFICLRLALLEETMLEIASTRSAMLGKYVRFEKVPPIDARLKEMFSNRIYTLGLTSHENFTPFEEKFFIDKGKYSRDPNAKVFTEHLVLCSKYIKTLNLAIPCESKERITQYIKNCLVGNFGFERESYVNLITEAARVAFFTTILGTLDIFYIDFYYSIRKINASLEIRKKRIARSIKTEPTVNYFLRLAEACITFDYNLFNGIDTQTVLEVLHCYSPTEAIFRNALLLSNRNEYYDASNLLTQRLNFLRKGIDIIIIIRCLMIMGMIYCEGGAIQAGQNALEYALETAKKKHLGNFVAFIQRRLAYAKLLKVDFQCAEELLNESGRVLEEAQQICLERGLFYVTRYEFYKRKLMNIKHPVNKDTEKNIKNCKLKKNYYMIILDKKILINDLSMALEIFSDNYPLLEKNLYREILQLPPNFLSSNEILHQMSTEILEIGKLRFKTSTLNWFLL